MIYIYTYIYTQHIKYVRIYKCICYMCYICYKCTHMCIYVCVYIYTYQYINLVLNCPIFKSKDIFCVKSRTSEKGHI